MKKLRTTLIALFAVLGSSLYAQLATGDYYLFNRGAKNADVHYALNFGSTNGYTAVFAEHPHVVKLTNVSGDLYTIDTYNDGSTNHFLSSSGLSNGAATNFTIVQKSSGIYTISKDGGTTFVGYNPSKTCVSKGEQLSTGANQAVQDVDMALTDGTSSSAEWEIKTRAELIAELSSATSDNPIDATFLISAPNFSRHDITTAWSGYSGSNTGSCSGTPYNQCAFYFSQGSGFNCSQTLSDIPSGRYRLKVQGFYRSSSDGSAKGYYTAGTETARLTTLLYADDQTAPLRSVYSNPQTTKFFEIAAGTTNYIREDATVGGWYPYYKNSDTDYNRYAVVCTAFDMGLFEAAVLDQVQYNQVEIELSTNTMNIGIKNASGHTNDWACFDNFELYYLGPLQDLTPLKDQYYALCTKIQNLFIDQTSVYTDENGAVTAYNTVKSTQDAIVEAATTEQEITDAKDALWVAAVAFLKDVKVNDGMYFDMTSFMVNPEVAPSSSTTATGWTTTANLDFGRYQITQFSTSVPFDMHQVVENMPAGMYEVKVRGFFRPGGFSDTDMTSVANAEVPTLIYLNETEQPLVNICADGSPTQLSEGASTSVNGTTIYIPNSRSHLDPFFAANYYWNTLPAVVSEDGDLTIGLKYDTFTSGGWGVISDFHLHYCGTLDLSAWQQQLALVVSQAQSLVIPTLPKRRLIDVIQQNDKTYTTVEGYQTAIANINAAIALAEPYVEPYAQYKTMRQMVQERFIDQTSVYTDPNDAAGTYARALSATNTAVENVQSVAALESEITNLWNAALTFMKDVEINDGQGFDLTWMIGDADFSDSNYKSYWTEDLASSTTVGVTNGIMRYYNSSFDLHQQLPYTLPAGAYRMKVDGFERTNDPMNTAWEDYQNGSSVVTGTLYLNSNEQLITNLFDVQTVTSNTLGGAQPDGASFYVPNGSSAANQYLQGGYYPNTMVGVLADDALVTIGYRCANATAWTAVDNFQLEFIGEVPQVSLNNEAGELVPVCAPFTLSTEDTGVEELYALGGENNYIMSIYPVSTIPAGTPCYAKFSTANYSAPMEMTLSDGKKFVLPWTGGLAAVDAANTSWTYYDVNLENYSLSDIEVLSFDDMKYSVNLENFAARRYTDIVNYDGSSDASEVAQYNVAPPTRRDIPNAVMIPLPPHNDEVEVTVVDDNLVDIVASVTVPASASEAYIYNLQPQKTYFFQTTNCSDYRGWFHTEGRLRMVYAPSAYNIRDLGGWETQDNCRTTYGHLFRGSTLNGYVNCTPEDIQALKDLGIGGEIDLRYQESYDKDMGCGTSAFGFGPDDYYFAAANDWTAANLNESGTQQRLKAEFDFILDHFRQGKAVYYHCAWGADRTGMLSFLLEGLLGLTIDQIYKDYELTSFSAAPGATNRLKTSFQDRIDVILALDGATLRDKFENYFINKLGVSMDDITYFRSVMLEVYPLKIDEDANVPVCYDGNAIISLHRTLKEGMHNTIVLPCNLPLWQAKYFFGDDVKMEKITAFDEVLVTEEISEAPANIPFLLIPSKVNADNNYLLDNVKVFEAELQEATFTGGKLVGSYAASTEIKKSEDANYTNYVISNDRFYYINNTPAKMKGTRAYLVLETPSGSAKNIVTFGGVADGIETLAVDDLSNSVIYDLSGRRVTNPTRGIYIVNGKKCMIY